MLENKKYKVTISVDETFTINSMDNVTHDYIFNPRKLNRNHLYSTLKITVESIKRRFSIALIGDYYSYDTNCALIDNDILTILQNNTITQLNLSDVNLTLHKEFDCIGCCFALYKYSDSYIVFGEIEIIRLNKYFEKIWSFSGKDIFITQDNSISFIMTEDRIKLLDWIGTYYEIDYNGKLIKETDLKK